MKRNTRHGFTLVEMLVVIGIIAALAGLVLPAVLGGQAEAKNGVCKAQLKDIATAMNLHENNRGWYPGFVKEISTQGGNTVQVGWVPQLFRYMDKLQEYNAIIEDKDPERWIQKYDNFICPSANPDLGVELGTSGELLDYPFTYAMNCGQEDASYTESSDTRATAIGHNHTFDTDKIQKVSLDDLADGKSQTILMTENADLANWTTLGANPEPMQGVVFTAAAVTKDNVPFHYSRQPPTDQLDPEFARPWSYHAGGFNVAYADNHVESFQIDETDPQISYRLYRAQMTPSCGDHETDDEWDVSNCR